MNMKLDRKFKQILEEEVGLLSFALFMRVSRSSLGLSQGEFGKKIGISRANVCDIEKGRQSVSTELAVKVARKTGLSEKLALQACLQDQVCKVGSEAKVVVT